MLDSAAVANLPEPHSALPTRWSCNGTATPSGARWGEDRDHDPHLTLAEQAPAREK